MLKVNKLTIKTLKGRKLIENLSFTLNDGDKLAIIGEEGNGKSTLLKAIFDKNDLIDYAQVTGSIESSGEVFGYLEQKLSNNWHDFSVLDYLLMKVPNGEVNYSLYNQFKKINNYIKKFNLNDNLLDENTLVGSLSGGEQVKVQLLKILLQEPTILLLDEPTNDLDIDTLVWLEDFINNFDKPIIFISHDETLLEHCANMILHLEQLIKKTRPKHTLFKGGYDDYVATRQRGLEKQTQIAYNERREKEKKEEVLRRIREKVEHSLSSSKKDPANGRIVAKKMASIKAQERKLESDELTEIPDVEESIKLLVDETITIPNQKELLNVHLENLSVPGKMLAKNIDLVVKGAKKVAIIGKNGTGKSTLLKTLLPILQSTRGLKVGYFSQNYYETLDYDKTPVDELTYVNATFNARTFLGSLKFTSEEMTHKIADLSEGQKAKLLLLKLIIEKNNVLVLDEPTRNLSPLSNPVIRKILNQFNGAIISVSHDRKFIENVCDTVYALDEDGLHSVSLTDDL